MSLTASLVLTTVTDPVLLQGYFDNLSSHGHLDQLRVIVIPDHKTPAAAFDRCAALHARGMNVACPSLEEQDAYLFRLGLPPDFIPRNSDNRRNVGYLMALETGADFLISIDDDNYCPETEDYFAAHSVVCDPPAPLRMLQSPGHWYNVCELLRFEPARCVYPRGFPYFARHKPTITSMVDRNASVRINAGLWLSDPDLDAPTWMAAPVSGRSFSGPSVILAPDTWAPVNSQNTALHRDAIPSYYFIRMGAEIGAFPIERFGDIFSGYFCLACAVHLGAAVRFGTPVADHRRNAHDYLRDAAHEMTGILLLEELLLWLQEAQLEGSDFAQAYLSLSHLLEDFTMRARGSLWTDAARSYLLQTAERMRVWLRTCRTLC
jgi:hypothetical protein